MKDVSDLETTQIYLYAAGQIPFKQILTQESVQGIRSAFGFREPSNVLGANELVFEGGMIDIGPLGKVTLTRVHLGERRIIISVAGSSAVAGGVFDVLCRIISGMEPTRRFDKINPVTVKEETTCVARLDLEWEDFLNPVFVEFLRADVTGAVSSKDAAASLSHAKYRITFSYTPTTTVISESGISLAPKDFVVEPLANSPLSERRYLTSSPTDSETHLRLVEMLESALNRTKMRKAGS